VAGDEAIRSLGRGRKARNAAVGGERPPMSRRFRQRAENGFRALEDFAVWGQENYGTPESFR
jgi:hypothetical protein